jgi:hypothetical protein
MKIASWSLAVLLLVGTSARSDEPAPQKTLETIKKQKVERLRATEAYFRRAGKVVSADYYRRAAEQAEKKGGRPPTIYVPVIKVDGLEREEAFRLTEVLIRSIERDTPYKVVGSPEDADLIFEGTVKPGSRPKP